MAKEYLAAIHFRYGTKKSKSLPRLSIVFLNFSLWSPLNKSCLNELKFWEASENHKSSICWKFQLSISCGTQKSAKIPLPVVLSCPSFFLALPQNLDKNINSFHIQISCYFLNFAVQEFLPKNASKKIPSKKILPKNSSQKILPKNSKKIPNF